MLWARPQTHYPDLLIEQSEFEVQKRRCFFCIRTGWLSQDLGTQLEKDHPRIGLVSDLAELMGYYGNFTGIKLNFHKG